MRKRWTLQPGSEEAEAILRTEYGRMPVSFDSEESGEEARKLLQTAAEALQQFKEIYRVHGIR